MQQVATASYQLPPTSPVAHALAWQCNRARTHTGTQRPGRATRFVVFKVARSGSTWLTEALDRALPGTQVTFEPYGRRTCHRRSSRAAEEACLTQLLSNRCLKAEVPPNRTMAKAVSAEALCSPCRRCTEVPVASAGLVLNARFVDRVSWAHVLLGAPDAQATRIVNLRRTNLVRLTVSKYEHNGLAPHCGPTCMQKNGSGLAIDDVDAFVAALSSYSIDDQGEWQHTQTSCGP